jgi:ATP-dependent DNA ligase
MATFPLLFGEASTGKVKQWSIHVLEEDGCGVIVTEHGYEGGKIQSNQKVVREGKNLGKKNATTALQQAIQEARAMWLKKKESGYAPRDVEDGQTQAQAQGQDEVEEVDAKEEVEEKGRGKGQDASVPSVMLAHDYHKRGKDIRFPCFVQPKLDGTRCVAVPGKGLFSRNKKAYPHLEHIRREVDRLPPTIVLDGELYSEELTFQEIVGLVKSETLKPGDAEKQRKIRLHVYDIICDHPYESRLANLKLLFRRLRPEHLVLVPTERCQGEADMKERHAEYMAAGYEGIMLRNGVGAYRGVRCVDLQKYKEFLDKEYVVVGYQEGQGLEEGCVIWLCETERGARFSCRPRGSREERQRLFQEGAAHVGKRLTVRYQEETDDGLPRFPVGIALRDYE